jgi:hypothetical protein
MNSLQHRIDHFVELGKRLNDSYSEANPVISKAKAANPWFTEESIRTAMEGIIHNYLDQEKLRNWVDQYEITSLSSKTVGTVLAGNIPLVGFHDMLSIIIAGHKAMIKPSSKDYILINHIVELLNDINPSVKDHIKIVDKLSNYDAIIATGSNNSGQYFRKYFKNVPHIIRGNRNSVGIISGNETKEDLVLLGKDIFTYYGLGCRNVSKLYLPKSYDIQELLEALHEYNNVNLHYKYKNNFDYNIALYLLNKQTFYNNGSIILKEDKSIASRIASCNYEYYTLEEELISLIQEQNDKIQCIVARRDIPGIKSVRFGLAQQPNLMDYADGIDTMAFLTKL